MSLIRVTSTHRGRGANIIDAYVKELLFNTERFINWKTQGTGTDFFYKGVTDAGKLQQMSYRTATNKAGIETLLGETGNATFIDIPIIGVTEANWEVSTTYGFTTDKIILGYDNDAGTDSYLWIETESGKALKVKSSLSISEIDDLAKDIVPIAENVVFTGTLQVGETLTGDYDYSDEGGEAESGSTFKWYAADDDAGTSEGAISGATSITYVVDVAYVDKYIKFSVIPKNADGTGVETFSIYQGPIIAA